MSTCLTSDYRYLLQRAWDEHSSIQFIDRANHFLELFQTDNPNCKEIYERENIQNIAKIKALRYTNTNTYPFASTFSNSTRNQKTFTDGIQVAIEDGMEELKTIMEKMTIQEGQIPLLFTIDFEDANLTEDEKDKKREQYFAYLFKCIEGNYFFAPYNRIEHNEILNDLPLKGSILDEEIFKKIYDRIMISDKWNRIYIIRLTEKDILKYSNIYKNPSEVLTSNQSYITLDLFKVLGSTESNQKISKVLIASADVTGIRTEVYYRDYFSEHKPFIIISALSIVTILVFLAYFKKNQKYRKENNIFEVNSNITYSFFTSITFGILFFIFTSFFFPYNNLFSLIIGEWIDVSSKASFYYLGFTILFVISFLLFIVYIFSNKFIDSSFLLKDFFGLPMLFSISSLGIIFSIIIKISVYMDLYKIFLYNNDSLEYILYLYIYPISIMTIFLILGLVLQEFNKLIQLKKTFEMQIENVSYLNHSNQVKSKKGNVNKLILFSIVIIFFLLSFIVLFLLEIMKSNVTQISILDSDYRLNNSLVEKIKDYFNHIIYFKSNITKITTLWEHIYISFLFIISIVSYGILKIFIINSDFETNNLDLNKNKLERLDSQENFEKFFHDRMDEYLIKNLNSSGKEYSSNSIFTLILGHEKSGKKELSRNIIDSFVKNFEKKIIEINFSDPLVNEDEHSKFIEVGKSVIPDIAALYGSHKFGKLLREKSKSPFLEFLGEIPVVGKILNFLISSEIVLDKQESERNLIEEVSKIYIEYIKSITYTNKRKINFILILENIHKCNNFSFEILLNILNEIKRLDKKQNIDNKTYIILTTNKNKNYLDLNDNKLDLFKYIYSEKENNKLIINSNSKFNFTIHEVEGFKKAEFNYIMREKYNFSRTEFNNHFIDKLFHTLKREDHIFLYDINLTLRNYVSKNIISFNNKKVNVNSFVQNIDLPEELTYEIKENINKLNEEEKYLVLASAQFNDKFQSNQLSSSIGIDLRKVEFILYSISRKFPNLYSFKDLKFVTIDKRVRDYINTTIFHNYPNGSMNDFLLNHLSNNFVKEYTLGNEIDDENLRRLSHFSFYLNDPSLIFTVNSLFIRNAYFVSRDRLKVFSVLDRLYNEVFTSTDHEMKDKFLYLVSVHYNETGIKFNTNIKIEKLKMLVSLNNIPKCKTGLRYLSIIRMQFDFEEKKIDNTQDMILFQEEELNKLDT